MLRPSNGLTTLENISTCEQLNPMSVDTGVKPVLMPITRFGEILEVRPDGIPETMRPVTLARLVTVNPWEDGIF